MGIKLRYLPNCRWTILLLGFRRKISAQFWRWEQNQPENWTYSDELFLRFPATASFAAEFQGIREKTLRGARAVFLEEREKYREEKHVGYDFYTPIPFSKRGEILKRRHT